VQPPPVKEAEQPCICEEIGEAVDGLTGTVGGATGAVTGGVDVLGK
jgi:hypothetical protein